jgi:hypothetical protein
MKKISRIFFWVIIIFLAIIITRNLIVKTAVEALVKAFIGLELSIKNTDIGLMKHYVEAKDLRLYNPKGFKDPVMVDMPLIYVDYNPNSFFKKNIHLNKVAIYLRELVVIKNKSGELNLNSLKVVREGKKPVAGQKRKAKAVPLKIDVLDLKIDRAVYKDYSAAVTPRVKEFNININERYQDVNDASSLVSLIIVRALAKTAISQMANFDLGPLRGQAEEAFKKVSRLATDTVSGAMAGTDSLDKDTKATIETTVNKAKEALKEIWPFSQEKP